MQIRTLAELIDVPHPAWPEIAAAITNAPVPVEVLEGTNQGAALYSLQVTVGSALGALAYNCGGLVIDHGWVRLLGGGCDDLPSLAAANNLGEPETVKGPPPYLTVGFDVLGGHFAIDGGGLGFAPGEVCYFAPDLLEWESTGLGHGAFVQAFLGGVTTNFYKSLRCPGWEQEVSQLKLDQGIALWTPPSTEQGKDLSKVTRQAVPFSELLNL